MKVGSVPEDERLYRIAQLTSEERLNDSQTEINQCSLKKMYEAQLEEALVERHRVSTQVYALKKKMRLREQKCGRASQRQRLDFDHYSTMIRMKDEIVNDCSNELEKLRGEKTDSRKPASLPPVTRSNQMSNRKKGGFTNDDNNNTVDDDCHDEHDTDDDNDGKATADCTATPKRRVTIRGATVDLMDVKSTDSSDVGDDEDDIDGDGHVSDVADDTYDGNVADDALDMYDG